MRKLLAVFLCLALTANSSYGAFTTELSINNTFNTPTYGSPVSHSGSSANIALSGLFSGSITVNIITSPHSVTITFVGNNVQRTGSTGYGEMNLRVVWTDSTPTPSVFTSPGGYSSSSGVTNTNVGITTSGSTGLNIASVTSSVSVNSNPHFTPAGFSGGPVSLTTVLTLGGTLNVSGASVTYTIPQAGTGYSGANFSATPVPVPPAFALLASAVPFGLLALRKRRK